MLVRAKVKVMGVKPNKDSATTLYSGIKTFYIKDYGAITEDCIKRANSDIAKAMYTKYNKYSCMSVEVQILKAEVTKDEG